MFDQAAGQSIQVTLYTDSHVVRGTVFTHQRRVSDILNHAEEPFIVLGDVTMDDWGSRSQPMHAEFAQVNLAAILFAVADTPSVADLQELGVARVSYGSAFQRAALAAVKRFAEGIRETDGHAAMREVMGGRELQELLGSRHRDR